jgi:hypothetical protein
MRNSQGWGVGCEVGKRDDLGLVNGFFVCFGGQRGRQLLPLDQAQRDTVHLLVTRHTSHVTRHTSHVTRHTSHVTRHTSHVTRHTSHEVR